MALPSFTKTAGTVFTFAARQHLSTFPVDQFFIKSPAYAELRKNKRTESGGDTLVIPVETGGDPLGGAYARADTLNIQDSENFTEANLNWAFYAEPVIIFDQDMWKCKGNEVKLLDLIKAKTTDSVKKLKTSVFRGLFVTSPAAKAIQGLPLAVADSPSSSGSYENLDGGATAQPSWRNYTSGSVGSFAANGLDALTLMIRTLSDQSTAGSPTAICTDPTTWGYIHKEVVAFGEVQVPMGMPNDPMAGMGFRQVSWMGVPIYSDPYCNSGVAYAIHPDAAQVVEMDGAAFVLSPHGFVSGYALGQPAMIAQVVWNGQLATSERRGLGKLYGITA